MKIYHVDSHRYAGRYDLSIEKEAFAKAGHDFFLMDCKTDEEVKARCADADALLAGGLKIGADCINALPNLKLMVRYGVGFDVFDYDAATAKGVKICNIPHYCVPEVATHVVGLILACTRNIFAYTLNTRANDYGVVKPGLLEMRRNSSQTVGTVGFGNIARTVCQYLKDLSSISSRTTHILTYRFLKKRARKKSGSMSSSKSRTSSPSTPP